VLADDDLARGQHRRDGVGVARTAWDTTTPVELQRNRLDLFADAELFVQLVPGPDQALVERVLDRPPDWVCGCLADPVELRLGPLRGVRHGRARALQAGLQPVEGRALVAHRRVDDLLGTPPVEVRRVPGL